MTGTIQRKPHHQAPYFAHTATGDICLNWIELTASLVLFVFSHSILARGALKSGLTKVLGGSGFTIVYSLISLGLLWWVILAAGRAPYVEIWPWQEWQAIVPQIAMVLVCLLIALAIGRPNPFSFGGMNNDRYAPESPGIVRLFRHPLLAALFLWASAHLLANGDLAHVLVFGLFAGFSIFGMKIVDRRRQRLMGQERWTRLREATLAQPLSSVGGKLPDLVMRMVGAALIYMALLQMHQPLFGVNPLP